jgi:hypothetical protein
MRGLKTLYKRKLPANNYRVLIESFLAVVRLIKSRSKALCTPYKVRRLLLANVLSAARREQLISHLSYSV